MVRLTMAQFKEGVKHHQKRIRIKVLSLKLIVLFKIKCKRYGEHGIDDKLHKGLRNHLSMFGAMTGYQMKHRIGETYNGVRDVLFIFFKHVLRKELF